MVPDLDDTVRLLRGAVEAVDGDTIPSQHREVTIPVAHIGRDATQIVTPQEARPLRVLLPDGSVIPLDETVYLGRRPSVPRVHPGGTPVLIALASPARELSSTHLALSAVGGSFVARDMLSTNGTVVRAPGAPERMLLRGESAVLAPGTVIDLGEGNRLEVLAP